MHTMDGVFSLPEATRADYLRSLMQCFGCAYICLWQPYDSPLSNRLFFLDGVYNETNNQSSSSMGGTSISVAERLFNLYQRLTFVVNDDCVPGLAFRNQMPYLELQQLDLLRLASTVTQTQFYQEARIETAVFLGCNKGEIELGFSTILIDIQRVLGTLFPEDFSRLSQPIDQNPPSSSSSSWRTLSTGSLSPECSSLLFSVAGTSQPYFPETLAGVVPTTLSQLPVPNTQTRQQQQQQQQPPPPMQTLAQNQIIPGHHFPAPEAEQDAIIKAIIHVISSPPSTSSLHQHQNLPHSFVAHPEASAFKMYYNGPDITLQMGSDDNSRRQSLMKRSVAFSRRLHFMRMRERFQFQAARPGLQHTISERRRREKLNENFEALRALLPQGTKKHKASILTTAHETLKSLIAEIEKLTIRNQQLTALLSPKEASVIQESTNNVSSSNERLNVRVSDVPGPSSSEERVVDLQVIVRGETSQADMVIRLLEFLRRVQNVSLISMGANTHITEGTAINQINFRLRIVEGSEWDESAFQEAVRRVVADLTH